jgi:hypothetical protein
LCEQLDVVGALDGAVGPIKQRARGHSAGGGVGRVGPQRSWGAGPSGGVGLSPWGCGWSGVDAGAGAGLDDRGGVDSPQFVRCSLTLLGLLSGCASTSRPTCSTIRQWEVEKHIVRVFGDFGPRLRVLVSCLARIYACLIGMPGTGCLIMTVSPRCPLALFLRNR